ncbi:MAG: transcription factor S [Candidatus Gerdarchaeota archaeon]|nr:MAG: transcription factor S [Candidatus Gerdarchaeota archaeon]
MEFCDECGAMLTPKKIDGKVMMVCPKCGEKKKELTKEEQIVKEKVKHTEKESMVVIENPEQIKTMPTKKMHCPKCKSVQETQYWTVQTRSGDEAPTRFYRCTKCKTTWREYD